MPTPNKIIVQELFGHWSAWFEEDPGTAFGGDTPGTAVERLWSAYMRYVETFADRD